MFIFFNSSLTTRYMGTIYTFWTLYNENILQPAFYTKLSLLSHENDR